MIRLATKDSNDHLDTTRVRIIKKSVLLVAYGKNVNRPQGAIRREAILAATNHIEQISNEIDKKNRSGALVRVPDLVECFCISGPSLRKTQAMVAGIFFREKSGCELHRLGGNAPERLLDWRGKFIIAAYVQTMGNGNIDLRLSDLGLLLPHVHETAKPLLSVPHSSRIEISHQKQVCETSNLLQKQAG